MLELLKLLKELRDIATGRANMLHISKDVGALFAVDDPLINRISELATTYLIATNGELHLYNVRTIEMQTGAKIKIVERSVGEYILAGIYISDGCILFGG